VTPRLATRGPAAPRDPSLSGRRARCPPRQRYEQRATGWLALLRPGLRRCVERGLRCIRPTSASQPISTTSTHASLRFQHLFEACASPLRPGLADQDDGGWRTWRFTTPDPLRRAAPGWCAAFFFRALPIPPDLWHPCRCRTLPPRSSRDNRSPACRDRTAWTFVKETPTVRSRMPSIASLPRPARVAPMVESGHVRFPLLPGCRCLFARGPCAFAPVPRTRRPSPDGLQIG
jgi:hypothetical protein